jgi:replicative DNA helicase
VPEPARRVPHDLDAEESLLAACLTSRDARILTHELGVTPADFYKPNHQAIYQAIVTLTTADQPVDPVTVAAELRHTGHPIDRTQVLQLLEAPSTAPAGYARIVRTHSRSRQLLQLAGDLTQAIYDGAPTDTLADQIARTTDSLNTFLAIEIPSFPEPS